ncbi:MAG TPA: arginine deiminase family protein [Sphingomicrobium sp.]|nr:arginine deiminase family protein [Sphingomicrobium sp.]
MSEPPSAITCRSTSGRSLLRFNRGIVRSPARSVVDGLRASDRGNPTYEGVKAEHDAYVAALKAAGVAIMILPALEAFPDSMFVEDPALTFSEGAILFRPGAQSRSGEAGEIAPILRQLFGKLLELPCGFADGGDVLVTPRNVMIGLSGRTDRVGAEALIICLAELGHEGLIVETPDDVLHLKTACSLLDETTVLCTPQLAGTGIFDGFRTLITPDGEEAAANALRVNDVVLVGSDFAKTAQMLGGLGYQIIPVPTSQISKIDAGLSCMSLRWQAN